MQKPEIVYLRRTACIIEPKATAVTLERSIRARDALLEMIEARTAAKREELNKLLEELETLQPKEEAARRDVEDLRERMRPRLLVGRGNPASFKRRQKPPTAKELQKAIAVHKRWHRAVERLQAQVAELEEYLLAPRRIIMNAFFRDTEHLIPRKRQEPNNKNKTVFLRVFFELDGKDEHLQRRKEQQGVYIPT